MGLLELFPTRCLSEKLSIRKEPMLVRVAILFVSFLT